MFENQNILARHGGVCEGVLLAEGVHEGEGDGHRQKQVRQRQVENENVSGSSHLFPSQYSGNDKGVTNN